MSTIYLELLDDIVMDVCFEMHRKLKLGLLCLNCDSLYSDVIHKSGCDIFGQSSTEISTIDSFECVNCKRVVVASRYAPHLEKCMGFGTIFPSFLYLFQGRNASRNASRRLANAAKADEYQEILLKHLEQEHLDKYNEVTTTTTSTSISNSDFSMEGIKKNVLLFFSLNKIVFLWCCLFIFLKEDDKKKKKKKKSKEKKPKKAKNEPTAAASVAIEVKKGILKRGLK